MVKKYILILFILMCLSLISIPAEAQGGLAAGFILGDPTGLTLKYNSFDFTLGWKDDGDFHLIGDYVWTFPNLIQGQGNLSFPVYLGGGIHLFNNEHDNDDKHDNADDDDEFNIGVRFKAGIGVMIQQRFEVYAEVGLGIFIIPDTDGNTTGGIGFRIYF